MRLAVVLVACLACAACGQSASHTTSTRSVSGGQIWAPASSGAAVFAHNCQSCHSLIGNESEHKQGGDLVGYSMSRAQILAQTRVMPTRPLTAGELNAVVEYVLRAQQRHAGG